MQLNRDRLLKLMGMATSAHDGEALNALRMANRMLTECKLDWSFIIMETVVPPPKPIVQENVGSRDGILAMFADLKGAEYKMTARAKAFVHGLFDHFIKYGTLSKKQYDSLVNTHATMCDLKATA